MLALPGDPAGPDVLVERAAAAEAAGFSSAWLTQVGSGDALTVLAMAGSVTDEIELGTGVVPTYPRHPAMLAEQALTVQNATGNRLALGIGLSHKFVIENSLGLDYSKPVAHTRDYLTVLNGLLEDGSVDHRGGEYRVRARVKVAGAEKPTVLFAALGPAMLRLCGQLSDGTITWMGGLDYLREAAVPTMSAAAQSAGRPAPRFVAMAPVLVASDMDAGREAVDAAFGHYGQAPSYRATLDRGGASGPADVAVIGGADAIEAGLRAFAAVGVTDFVGWVPPQAPARDATVELLAELAIANGR